MIVLLAAAMQTAAPCLALDEALALASDQSVGAQIALADAEETLAERDAVRASARPQISAFTQSGIGDNGLVAGRIENQAGLRATQRLYDFGKTRLAADALGAQAEAATARAAEARDEEVFAAADAWLTAAAARQQAAAVEAERADLETLAQTLDRLSRAGDATLAELTGARTQAADARAQAAALALQAQRATLALGRLTRVAAEPCPGDLPVVSPSDAPDTDHPSIEAAAAAVRAAEAERRLERRSRLPDIDVVGTAAYGYDDLAEEWGVSERVGLNVSVPLYTSGQQAARFRGSGARLGRAQAQETLARRAIEEERAAARATYAALNTQLDARAAAADAKREQFALTEAAFDRGFATLRELIEVRAELTEREVAVIATRRDRALEGVRLRLLSGQPSP